MYNNVESHGVINVITQYFDNNSIVIKFNHLSAIRICPEESILRRIWKVVNWTYVDNWIVGNHRIRIADYPPPICRTFIYVCPESHSFTVVFKIVVIIRPIGLQFG